MNAREEIKIPWWKRLWWWFAWNLTGRKRPAYDYQENEDE